MHSSPPCRNWVASSGLQHRRSTRCLRWFRNVADRLECMAMMTSAKTGFWSAKSDITAGTVQLEDIPRLRRRNPLPSSSISFGMTLAMAIACGVPGANVYYNQPMLGIMEAAFPGQVAGVGLVPTATQLGFAAGLLLLVPLGDRFERRRLTLIQFAALTLSLAGAALAPDAWSLVVASTLVGVTSSVAQQIVPFSAELAEPSHRGATIGTVMSGLLCGILLGRVLGGAVSDHYGWRATFWLGLLMTVAVGLALAAVLPRSHPGTRESYGALLKSLVILWREGGGLRRGALI